MIQRLYETLSRQELLYHELGAIDNGTIIIVAKSMDAEGVMEVMRIKELADKYHLITQWDGSNIRIRQ